MQGLLEDVQARHFGRWPSHLTYGFTVNQKCLLSAYDHTFFARHHTQVRHIGFGCRVRGHLFGTSTGSRLSDISWSTAVDPPPLGGSFSITNPRCSNSDNLDTVNGNERPFPRFTEFCVLVMILISPEVEVRTGTLPRTELSASD